MKKPFLTRAAGQLLLVLALAGYGFGGRGAESAAVQRSVMGRVKRVGEAKTVSVEPMGPSLGPVHCQQAAVQPPLAADVLASLQHQAVTEAKGRLPIGFARAFDPAIVVSRDTVRAEDWTVLTNGWRIYSVEVASAGALGMRVHLEALALPKGARLVVYDPAKPARAKVVAVAEKLPPEGETWAKAQFAEKVVVECQVPPGAETAEVNFAVTAVSHLYRLPRVVAKDLYDAGPCHKDVSCYPEWAEEAAGVAEMVFEDNGTTYLCTGCLLSCGNTNVVADYFLTAHHCIPNQAAASTLELYWFYQTSRCNGTPPSMNTVPQTAGGADFLAGADGSDFAFLQLREAPPAGVYALGWSRETPKLSDVLTCIQHPQGDYKRISFGYESSFNGSFLYVQWYSGVTEEGSSGSPLLNPNHQVIGQLWGGSSSCDYPNGLDRFGRFDVTYNAIRNWIDPVSRLRGTYTGLFEPTNGAPFSGVGAVTLTTTVSGKFTGKLQAGSLRYVLRGQFDREGNARVTAPAGNLSAVTVTLHLDVTGVSDRITGTINGGTWTAGLAADRAVYDSRSNPAPQQGAYTMVLPGNYGSTTEPGGDGYATVSVDKAGRIRLSGLLADGTKVTQSTVVSKAGQWPLYIPLYKSGGFVLSWLTFSNSMAGELGGNLAWVKPAGQAACYPGGFNLQTSVVGARYSRPAASQPLLNTVKAALVLTGGRPTQGITNSFVLNGQKAVSDPVNKLKLSFTPTSGMFRGSVAGTGAAKALPFSGVVLANQNFGAGSFMSGGQSGRVMLEPTP
jgi:hypothetical protein